MKLMKYLILLLTVLLSINLIAQVPLDENGDIDLKRLSPEDAKRIFGPMYNPKIFKVNGESRYIKESIINGNKITTILYNYGSICAPNVLPNVADLVWNGLGYGFEFGPLAAAQVTGDSNKVLQIVSDSFVRTGQGDYSPDGSVKWGWLPKKGYVDTTQNEIARLNSPDEDGDGKPDSWPDIWYSEGAGKYIWPAFLGDQATAPDEEVYYVVDDYTNSEFPYFPFLSDTTKRGLGLDMEVRVLQFNNPLAEDIMFLVYQITNASEKTLPIVYFGMHGDPHVGGSGNYADDRSGFVDPSGFSLQSGVQFSQRARNMVYSWDQDKEGDGGLPTGYFGWKFLESPSRPDDGQDNDDDGIADESLENVAGRYIDGASISLETGIFDLEKYTATFGEPKPRFEGDEDGDWDPDRDDIGIDGIGAESPNYPGPDYGEGDGLPSQAWYLDLNNNGQFDSGETLSDSRIEGYKWAGSEPNFGLRDISESDQIGLTSFHAAIYGNTTNVPKQDELMWEWLSAGRIDPEDSGQELLTQEGDNVFNFGTGPIYNFASGATERFSMGILFGNNLADLILNAETSTRILEADYRFAQPPAKPTVNAVAEDGKVILYWDSKAEESIDPLTGDKDFLGYKIYRSRDYTFSDVYTITDGRGNAFLGEAYVNDLTGEIAQWHYELDPTVYVNGFHPVEYQGRAVKYWCGDVNYKDGLVHEFVDSNVTNGVTYYYAVIAYDGGSTAEGKALPPSETQSVILRDPVTGELTFDVNTVGVTPVPKGSGLSDAEAGAAGKPNQVYGNSTGDIFIKVLDDMKVVDDKVYSIDFIEDTKYNVMDSSGISERIISNGSKFVALSKSNIISESVVVKDMGGNIISPENYFINTEQGQIKSNDNNGLPANEEFEINYRYYPVFESTLLNFGDSNPSFDGMKIYVQNEVLALDTIDTGFENDEIDIIYSAKLAPIGLGNPSNYRADYEIIFKDLSDTLAGGIWNSTGDTVFNTLNQPTVCPFTIRIVNPFDTTATYRIVEEKPTQSNGQWDWNETILLQPKGEQGFNTTYAVKFSIPGDSITTDPQFPEEGDIFNVITTKPFQAGDKYVFSTEASQFEKQSANDKLNEIYAVPNPYVAYSIGENPGRTSNLRGEKEIQFRNLPPECTIRIFTITGEMVREINKNDYSSIASWDLLTFEGQRVAYGVYIYHIEVPGVGEKIGRLALIK